MKRPMPVRARLGFTLLELLLVVALMATAFALFAGTLVGALPGQQLRTATATLAAELRATRARAVATGSDQVFEIDPVQRRWQSGASRGDPRRSGEIDDALRVAATVAREEQPGPGIAAVRFFADGSSTGGRIVLSRNDAAWRIDIAWLTGAVTVERGPGVPR